MSFQKLQWLFPISVTLHNSEEAIWMPGWASQHHIQLPLAPAPAGQIRFALVELTMAAFAVTYLSQRKGKQSFWAYVMFGSIVAVIVNVFVPHVPATLVYRRYTPGVVTAVLVNLPLMSLLVFSSLRERWVSGARAIVSAVVVPVVIGGIIALLFLLGSRFESLTEPLVEPPVMKRWSPHSTGMRIREFSNGRTHEPRTPLIRSCPRGVTRSLIFAVLLARSICAVSQDKHKAADVNAGSAEGKIMQLISMYAKAADEADPALASRVWCDSSLDSLINPVGRWHGVEQIMDFYRHEMGDRYSSRNLKITDISVQVYADAAWAEFNWNFSAKRGRDGSPVSFQGMETQIYRKHRDGWCLVHVHYSALPAEKKPQTE